MSNCFPRCSDPSGSPPVPVGLRQQGKLPFLLILPAIFLSSCVSPALAADESAGQLFPEPFLIEHHVVQTEPDGSVFATEPVVDHYGGSWIVSVRGDGSRLIVDFSRREMTEVRPDRGIYTVFGFDRFAELQRRLRYADRPATDEEANDKSGEEAQEPKKPIFAFSDRPIRHGLTGPAESSPAEAGLLDRSGVRRLSVSAAFSEEGQTTTMEIWLDPEITLGAAALEGLESFEQILVNRDDADTVAPTRLISAARREAGGALIFRTSRPLGVGEDGAPIGSVDDVATRVEKLAAFPYDLLEIPEGLQRTPHPLELMVDHAEQEAELRAMMSVRPDGQ